MKTVTFDYDDTLSNKEVQDYAKQLISKGFNVMIVTSRYEDSLKHRYPNSKPNSDIYHTAKQLGISKEHIKFTNQNLKSDELKKLKSIVHIDNNMNELMHLQGTNVKGVDVTRPGWKNQVNKTLGL